MKPYERLGLPPVLTGETVDPPLRGEPRYGLEFARLADIVEEEPAWSG
jgi:hypothetical protein